ncbi:Glutathione S-transferase GST-4.5 [BD1-7 clade bacterium]|uniref:glutathione transferase n=1 Tax=BD1-7 clade bacterium TaxID=2029982 RepID=A0A5S9PKU4_9GAMM|nr:Glutathione S-transferase GST-4.5 [BD1-7 clade bacterium]
MITVHHLKQSRSTRIIWLLEELGIEYTVKSYDRNPQTHLAPESLRKIHPLGKAPIVEIGEQVLVESAAIMEYVITTFAPDQLRPDSESDAYATYLQWMHFAEGSAMLPVLLDMFTADLNLNDAPVLYYAKKERDLDFAYIDKHLQRYEFFAGSQFTAADIMMMTVLLFATGRGMLEGYDAINEYVQRLSSREAFIVAAGYE